MYTCIYICIHTCIAGYSLRKPSSCRTSAMCTSPLVRHRKGCNHVVWQMWYGRYLLCVRCRAHHGDRNWHGPITHPRTPAHPPTPTRHPTHQSPTTPAPPSLSSPPLDLRPRLASVEDGASLWMPLTQSTAVDASASAQSSSPPKPSQASAALGGLPPARSGIQMPWLIACRE